MSDFFEIDFLDVQCDSSGDAITVRCVIDGVQSIHVVDGGFQKTGDYIAGHIRKHYGNPKWIDHVVVTHPDGDHAAGLATVLSEFEVGTLWMIRPWLYADVLIDQFPRFSSVENLKKRLREIYPTIAALEDLADERGVSIEEPLQGAKIGQFSVLAPSPERLLELIVESDKTPESVDRGAQSLSEAITRMVTKVVNLVRAAWGEETFPEDGTSAENEMSIIQYARLCGDDILLTGDAGRDALNEAADYAPLVGLTLPGLNRFQVPHHGSRHNVSSDLLDRWLGQQLAVKPQDGATTFSAAVSASKADEKHPRNSVVRGLIHRGGKVVTTQGADLRWGRNAPPREGWGPASALDYPEEQEE